MKRQFLGYIASVIVLLLMWQAASALVTLTGDIRIIRMVPGPDQIAVTLVQHWQEIGNHFLGTSYRLLTAIIISLLMAIPLGLYIGHAKWARQFLTPFIYTIYPIPKVVFWPLLFLLFSISSESQDLSRITFIILVVFFQLLVSIRDAAENIPKEYVVTAVAAGVSRAQIYLDVILPGALPAIFSSLRVSLGVGIFAAYLAETTFIIGTPEFGGLGYFIDQSGIINVKGVYAGIVAIAILGLALYLIIELLERWLCRWKYMGQDVQH